MAMAVIMTIFGIMVFEYVPGFAKSGVRVYCSQLIAAIDCSRENFNKLYSVLTA